MAARRLARPALTPPLPAEQMPDQQGGGLTGAGGHGHGRAASGGFLPRSTRRFPRGCQPAGDEESSGPPKCGREARVQDGRELVPSPSGTLRWAKSHCKGDGGIAAAFCPLWGYSDPLVLQCHGCSCPVPAQPGRTRCQPCPSRFAAAAPRPVSKITHDGKPGSKTALNPTSARHPSLPLCAPCIPGD